MTDTTSNSEASKKRGSWLRKLAWVVGTLVILLLIVYFVATSSAFFKGVILPKVSKAMNAEVTVSSASISPFSQVVLHDLKVQTTGAEPLVAAPEVRARYHLMDIIGGNINVDEIVLSSPTVVQVENPDGSSNLDPIMKSQQSKPQTTPSKPSKPTQVNLKKLTLTDATIRKIKLYQNNNRDLMELSHLNVNVDNVQNGQSGKLNAAAELKAENSASNPGGSAVMQGKLNGDFGFALTGDLKPASVKGNARLEVSRAEGAWSELNGSGAQLDCDVTPTDIKELVMRFQKSGADLGALRVNGPFDMAKTEGRLAIAVSSIDKKLLNLAGAKNGLDFGSTVLNSTNQVDITKSGSLISAAGQLTLSKFEVKRANEITPPLDLQARYDGTLDLAQSNSLLRELTITGTQRGQPLLKAELSSPMQISWGSTSNAVGDSTFNFTVADLDLKDWKPFLGSMEAEGKVNAQMKLLSQEAGQQLTFDLNSKVENLSAAMGSNHIRQATVNLQVNGTAAALKQFNLKQYELNVAHQSQPLLKVSGSGTYDQQTTNADLQVNAHVELAPALRLMPQPDTEVSSGSLDFKGHVVQKQGNQTVTGNLALANFTGRFSKNTFKNFGATTELDTAMNPQQVQLRNMAGKLTEAGNPGGTFELSGTYNRSSKAAQFTATLADFNQFGLRAFLEPMLTDKQLVSVALNGKASAQYDPQGASSMKADVQLANLVVRDSKNSFPAKPLEARFQADASLRKDVADVRRLQLTLSPTQRARNELLLTGRIDMTDTNAIQGQLKLTSEALDLTSYYDLFGGEAKAKPGATASAQASPGSGPASPQKEPEPAKLPLHNFTAEANIRHVYLREVEIADFQATTKIDGGHVVLNPFKLTLNGAPASMTLDMDLGVPGYKYDVSVNGQRIPLAPLVNSFKPERKGQIGGTLTAQGRIGGAGITDSSIQKNLNGQIGLTMTNLNLAVVNIKNPMLKALVNVVSLVPDMLRNPGAAGGTLLGAVLGKAGTTGGLADEMQKAPIDSLVLRGAVDKGRLDLQQVLVQSAAFQATAQGTVTLAAPLTNSILQVPVSVWLSRSQAERMSILPANTPTNAPYAKLPDFLTMRGTAGRPQTDINKLALAGTVLTSVGANLSGDSGGILRNVGGLLTGQRGATNAPAAGATNAPPAQGGLLQGLGGLLRESTTRQPTTTNAPATNQSPVNSLLDGLLGPKKK